MGNRPHRLLTSEIAAQSLAKPLCFILWACFLCIGLITIGRRRCWMDPELSADIDQRRLRTGVLPLKEKRPVGSLLTTETEAIDTLSFNLALVLGVYLLAYLFLRLLTFLLSFASDMGKQLATNL